MTKFDVGDEVSYIGISCRVVGVSLKAPYYVYSVRDSYDIKLSNIPENCLKHERDVKAALDAARYAAGCHNLLKEYLVGGR